MMMVMPHWYLIGLEDIDKESMITALQGLFLDQCSIEVGKDLMGLQA